VLLPSTLFPLSIQSLRSLKEHLSKVGYVEPDTLVLISQH
jgi:hypothetical protein